MEDSSKQTRPMLVVIVAFHGLYLLLGPTANGR